MDAHVDKFVGLEAENSWISGLVASLSSVTQEARLSEEMEEWELSPMECRNGLDLQLREKGKKVEVWMFSSEDPTENRRFGLLMVVQFYPEVNIICCVFQSGKEN